MQPITMPESTCVVIHRYEIGPVPTDWFYTVQTLEGDINRKLDDMYKEEGDKYYKDARAI